MATLLAIVLVLYVNHLGLEMLKAELLPFYAISFTLFLLLPPLLLASFFSPLIKASKETSAHLIGLFRNDRLLSAVVLALLLTPLLLLLFSFLPVGAIALILFVGIGIDLTIVLLKRLFALLDPFHSVDLFKKEGFRELSQDRDSDFCKSVTNISRIALQSVEKRNASLANHALDALEAFGEKFLSQAKSIAHPRADEELQKEGIQDTLKFLVLFLLQHLEEVEREALKKGEELVAGHIVTLVSKLAIYSERIDLSLTSFPLHFLGKMAEEANKNAAYEVSDRVTSGLIEVAKAFKSAQDLSYQDLKTPFISLISILEEIAKESFKRDKKQNIKVLALPFASLRELIEEEPLKSHRDSDIIRQQLNRVMGDFQALEAILATMPVLPKIVPEEEPQSKGTL